MPLSLYSRLHETGGTWPALMEQPVKFIWTHDAFRVGEDGPTHEPVEQEAQIRLMEKLKITKGTTPCWFYVRLMQKKPLRHGN